MQQALSRSCGKNLIEDSQGTKDLVSSTSPSLIENCTKKTPIFQRLPIMAAITDSSEQSILDITIQSHSPLIEETPQITHAPTKSKLKRTERVLFYEFDAATKFLIKTRIKIWINIVCVSLC